MQHKLSINSCYSLVRILKISNVLRENQVLEEKNIALSDSKLRITNFRWVLALPGHPMFYSMHSPTWLHHTSPFPLCFQNLLPSWISVYDLSSCFTEKTNQQEVHELSIPKISSYLHLCPQLWLLSCYSEGTVWPPSDGPSCLLLETTTPITVQSYCISLVFPFLQDSFHRHTSML